MKIYIDENKEFKSGVEISLNYRELNNLVDVLTKFKKEIEQFRESNKVKENLGFTHLHLKDCGLVEGNSKSDIVFYVDMNDK